MIELAIELLRDRRLDRYCAARIRLFDLVLSLCEPEPESRQVAAPGRREEATEIA